MMTTLLLDQSGRFFQTAFSNAFAWMVNLVIVFKSHCNFFLVSANAPNRRQTIIWTSNDYVFKCHTAQEHTRNKKKCYCLFILNFQGDKCSSRFSLHAYGCLLSTTDARGNWINGWLRLWTRCGGRHNIHQRHARGRVGERAACLLTY